MARPASGRWARHSPSTARGRCDQRGVSHGCLRTTCPTADESVVVCVVTVAALIRAPQARLVESFPGFPEEETSHLGVDVTARAPPSALAEARFRGDVNSGGRSPEGGRSFRAIQHVAPLCSEEQADLHTGPASAVRDIPEDAAGRSRRAGVVDRSPGCPRGRSRAGERSSRRLRGAAGSIVGRRLTARSDGELSVLQEVQGAQRLPNGHDRGHVQTGADRP
jgi:hypothetical protein